MSRSIRKLPAKKGQSKNSTAVVVRPAKPDAKDSVWTLLKRKMPDAPRVPMPVDVKPMLATLVDQPFDDADWQFELKLDGYRTLAYLNKGRVELRSRNNNSFNNKFSAIAEELSTWKLSALFDGEVVVLDEHGVPDFHGIQHWETQQQGQLVYYIFDVLWMEGSLLMNEPLGTRREVLQQMLPPSGSIRFSDHIDEIGKDFYEIARKNNMEGIIAKKTNSVYLPGARSANWLKIKIEERHEAVICGYTKKAGSDRLFSSLLLGVEDHGKLKYIGQVGTGYTEALQESLMKKMKPLESKVTPFGTIPPTTGRPVWLQPELICEVKYTELTPEGVMRHASFQGLRADKSFSDLNNKPRVEARTLVGTQPESKKGLARHDEEILIDGYELRLTNASKIFWPKEKISKGDLVRYYARIAETMLPYMQDRPQSLNRFPNGVEGESFYHKNMNGNVPDWIKTFKRYSESTGDAKDFLICNGAASIVYMANLGCIEMNPWHSRAANALCPDWCVIDLDPGEIAFEKVIETALVVKDVLDSLQIPSFPKTSGSTGIHIYIPLGAKYNYEQSKQLAELVANMVHNELPDFTSLVRNPRKRIDKIYIDYLQNRPIQTICAPYSVRPKPGATVSAPLHWEEVKRGLKIGKFTMKNIFERVRSEGDLFHGVLGKGIDLNRVVKGLASLL